MPHFIYCYGDRIYGGILKEKFKEIILKKMREYGIPSSILTTLCMLRRYLITQEKSKEAAEGKLKNVDGWKDCKGSINDDLDSFVNNLQNSEEIDNEEVSSFFTSKLTKEELKLVEQKNKEHMMTYLNSLSADVGIEEMKKSDSKDKYVHTRCIRRTEYLYLESEQTSSEDMSSQDFAENSSDDSFDDLSEHVLSDVSSDVRTTSEWAAGWDAGWTAGWDAGLVAGRMDDGMGRQSNDDSSNHLKSSTRRRNSL